MERTMKTLTNKEALKVALMAVRYAWEETTKESHRSDIAKTSDLKLAIEQALKEAFK